MEATHHVPVLLTEVVGALRPVRPDGLLVDATLGLGGHTEALLSRYAEVRVLGIDRDKAALEKAGRRLERFGERVRLVRGRHEEIVEILKSEGIEEVDGVLADLGASSMQFDDPERGFSFRFDGPLDMRMGQEGETAAELIERIDVVDLKRIIHRWGEEPMAILVCKAGETCTPEEIMEYCRQKLASYKRPRSVEFVDELPRNTMGKVLKRELREKYGQS